MSQSYKINLVFLKHHQLVLNSLSVCNYNLANPFFVMNSNQITRRPKDFEQI
jgi:hypothetical protein